MPDRDDEERAPALTRASQRVLRYGEDALYVGAAVLLTIGGAALLIEAVIDFITTAPDSVSDAVKLMLDTMLLLFILVELLSAVRTTVQERKLLAEPFLIVGMIATIKEVVVVSISTKDYFGADDGKFEDAILEIGVLAGLLIALALASFLSRRKEREPEE